MSTEKMRKRPPETDDGFGSIAVLLWCLEYSVTLYKSERESNRTSWTGWQLALFSFSFSAGSRNRVPVTPNAGFPSTRWYATGRDLAFATRFCVAYKLFLLSSFFFFPWLIVLFFGIRELVPCASWNYTFCGFSQFLLKPPANWQHRKIWVILPNSNVPCAMSLYFKVPSFRCVYWTKARDRWHQQQPCIVLSKVCHGSSKH